MVAKQLLACCVLFVVCASLVACDREGKEASLDETYLEDPDLVFAKSYGLVRITARHTSHTVPYPALRVPSSCRLMKQP
jgi:hypothetical protein